jgi:hypothetical protein
MSLRPRAAAPAARKALRVFSLIASLAALAGPARAGNPEDKAAADALYDQGKKLMASGQFAAACPKLAESQRLDPGVGTLLTLGDCYDRVGRKASAWTTFREAAALAKTRGQAGREKLARSRAAALEPRLSKLVIDVPADSDVAGITIQRNDEPVGKALWGTPLPIDAGQHTVRATAPGRKPWTLTVRAERDGQLVTVSVPLLAPEAAAAPAPAPPPRPPDTRPDVRPGGTQRALGFTAGGVGLAGIGVGVAFGFLALSKHDEAQANCAPTCAAGGGDAIQADAQKLALGSTIGFTAGGLLVAGGVVLLLTAPSFKTAVTVAPVITARVQGAVIGGVF